VKKIPIKKPGAVDMSKSNGQAEVHTEEQAKQSHEHEKELPPAADASEVQNEKAGVQKGAAEQSQARPTAGEAELQKALAERDNLLDRLARLQAEFDNYRKRIAKENAEVRDYAVADAGRALLPVIDSFGLALKNSNAKAEDLRTGVELIYKQLGDVLQKLNIQRVPAQGEPFDPRVHEAIEMVNSDEVPDNHVLEELQPGYRIKERLLRPAMVRVAKGK
jgi:molecular chaperone GrpE